MDMKDSSRTKELRKVGRVAPAFLLGLALASSATYAQTQPECAVKINNQWGNGSQVNVTVSNPNSEPVTNWHIELTYADSTINNSWSSKREGTNPYLFSGLEWNKTINSNGSYNFGFVASHNAGFEAPEITGCYSGDAPLEDTDSDGVADSTDQCSDTPAGQTVNTQGCSNSQLDDDNDGVMNSEDICPTTPSGVTVDSEGCEPAIVDDFTITLAPGSAEFTFALDNFNIAGDAGPNFTTLGYDVSQHDTDPRISISELSPSGEITFAFDTSSDPATPFALPLRLFFLNDELFAERISNWFTVTVLVDQADLDDDNDGVANGSDQCPDTPLGETVSPNGCSNSQLDADNDGVSDAQDQCPDTQTDHQLDVNGCSWEQRDDDDDGSTNQFDACPDTAPGAPVNTGGCALEQLDEDNDGINSAIDICPFTPETEAADAEGCSASQRDTDGDGVNDHLDICPATPNIETADTAGCSDSQRDDDQDGIANGLDQCPDTQGEPADAQGCGFSQRDDDNDGVLNLEDLCPTTPAGEAVNAEGCPLDDDNDGIINRDDNCPNTPAGEFVHPDGCAESQLDLDGDGIVSGDDHCPDSQPPYNELDSIGCTWEQRDNDEDQIANGVDACPESPLNSEVDEFGCAATERDTDQDGITDDLDQCSESSSPQVTAYGCDFLGDEDGDFIPNEIDFCPFSKGLVELHGCKASFNDFDGDGVVDNEDNCPTSLNSETAQSPMEPPLFFAEELEVDPSGCNNFDLHHDFDGDGTLELQDACPYTFRSTDQFDLDEKGCTNEERRDNDNDGIINGLDMCPETFGAKDLNGCPPEGHIHPNDDLDGDSVFNEQDHCPFTPQISPGLFEMVGPNGCLSLGVGSSGSPTEIGDERFALEDIDQDGIENGKDDCPATPAGHKVDPQGCTGVQAENRLDNDNDGVRNQWDMCDLIPGEFEIDNPQPQTRFGCAFEMDDFDHDGIPSSLDQCEHEEGLLIHNGCQLPHIAAATVTNPADPNFGIRAEDILGDRDFDGVMDEDDRCPHTRLDTELPATLSPSPEFLGCSQADMNDDDADGVINGRDRCPFTEEPSFLDSEGCSDLERLDSDNDQVINGEDLCPEILGFWQFNGCAHNANDADFDGIDNDSDACPLIRGFETDPNLPGVNIGNGCPDHEDSGDDDLDGIENFQDNCPNTPFGALVFNNVMGVDSSLIGCSVTQLNNENGSDNDNGGVPDFRDQCPDSKSGEVVNIDDCFDPTGDIDGDNVSNDIDQCQDTLHARPIDFEGCDVPRLPVVNASVRFTQLPDLSPENPNGPQDHMFNFAELAEVPENSNLDPFQLKQLEVGLPFELGNDHPVINIFNDRDGHAFIHVEPEFRHQTIRIPVRIKFTEANVFTNWFEIIISPRGSGSIVSADINSLIVNDQQLLFDTDIRLNEVFERLARDPFPEAGRELFKNFWRSQRSEQFPETPFFCTGETNSFPIVCDRFETEVAFMDDFETEREMDFYTLTAAVNRIDLRRGNWDDCGEHRLVFAAQGHPRGRKFFIFEARVPNPTPGDIRGCENTIRFWEDMAQLQGFDKAQRIREFFIDGAAQPPVMSPEHFFKESGQIRTNQFMGGDWLLKEHKLVDTCFGPDCKIFAETVTVKENPFGELFNPDTPAFAPPQIAQAAAEFQDHFLDSIDGLATEVFGALKITTDDHFNHGQSHSSGGEADENNFVLHFNNGGGVNSGFGGDIQFNLQGRNNADGSPLEAEQLLARATGLTCGGCHMPSNFGIDQPGAIGILAMPDGSFIDSWPQSLGFVHIDEQSNLSPALIDVFLPIRAAGFGDLLVELNATP